MRRQWQESSKFKVTGAFAGKLKYMALYGENILLSHLYER